MTDSLAVARTSLRFDWSEVDDGLLRRLLVAAYEAEGRSEDVLLLRGQSHGSLVKQAQRSLGRPPNVRYMDSMVDVLRDHWLPKLNRDQLDRIIWDVQLALSGPDRNAEPRTKAEKVDFLARRNRTDTFKWNLRAAFIREHKVEAVVVGSAPGQQRRQSGVVELIGLGDTDSRSPFPHQLTAWQSLDDMASSRPSNRRSGLVELPTGSGKTYTLVVWLLRRMQKEARTRVLWIANQQELLDQAARSFEEQAAYLPPEFVSRLRIVHGAANPATTLADTDVDVVCVTRQSLLGKQLDSAARARLQAFLTRPTVVVVDEAHHAVSKTYRQLLELIRSIAPTTIFVGMTATPWPNGYGMTQRLNELFPVKLAEVQVRDLVKSGVLARPVFHTAQTGETVHLDPAELRQMVGRDVPPSVLRRLDRPGRNATIVNTWSSRRDEWGKTLVFACDIEHADNLGELFTAAGAEVTVVHSRAEIERSGELHRFRIKPGPSVLVSVGMLLEGVDVPNARTAFLTRPTTSRILMRQMVGRVLRGEAGGGEATAHVVDLRDRWDADVDVLAPVEIPGLGCTVIETEEDQPHVLPAVLDEKTGDPLGEDVLRSIARAYGELRSLKPLPHTAALASTTLVGFYQLGDLNVPVFDHAKETWAELISDHLHGRPSSVRSPVELFGDLPVPRPVKRDVDSVIEFVRSHQTEPVLVEVRSVVSVRRFAQDLLDIEALTERQRIQTERQRIQWLRQRYESTLARSAYFSFQAFYEAVQQEILGLSGITGSGPDPESPLSKPSEPLSLPKLTKRTSRDLKPILTATAAQARAMLEDAGEDGYVELLRGEYLPAVEWTRRPVKSTYAYWAPRIGGRAKGSPVIRVNRCLQAPTTQISDELLQFLLWHELSHQLLPGRGHDAEFRRLESTWPDFTRLDYELDTLHERFDLLWLDKDLVPTQVANQA